MARSAKSANPDREALLEAPYASLTYRAVTDEARLLVETITAMLTKQELASGARQKKRKETEAAFRRAVEGFVGALLFAQNHKKSTGWTKHSTRAEYFTGEEVSHRNFKAVIEGLRRLNLIDHRKGFRDRLVGDDGETVPLRPYAPRFRATTKLLKLANDIGVSAKAALTHFIAALPSQPLQLRATSTRDRYGRKERGRKMSVLPNRKADRLRGDIVELNKFFDQFELRGGRHRGFTRIFNNGDHHAFDWNMGGRLYSLAEDSFQQMSAEERLGMTINGESVCEIDIKASWLTIFHAWHGQQLSFAADPYDRLGFPKADREVVKDWFTITWGKGKHFTRWPSVTRKKHNERAAEKLAANYEVKTIRERAFSTYPLLRKWGSDPTAWGQLMFDESRAVVSTMLRLMREHRVPALSVHDSLIVPASKQGLASRIMIEEYKAAVGVKPHLVVKR